MLIADRRYRARGGRRGLVGDVAIWAVPFGIIGGRLYHVITTWQPYFGSGGHPLDAFKIWEGGLGIWGAIALGGVGAYIGCRRHGVRAAAVRRRRGARRSWSRRRSAGGATGSTRSCSAGRRRCRGGCRSTRPTGRRATRRTRRSSPTFLYESLWCLGAAAVVVWADRRWRLGHGRAFMLYVALYTAGRFWIELLRIDDANHILGLRVNTWVSSLAFVGAVVAFVISARLPARPRDAGRAPARPVPVRRSRRARAGPGRPPTRPSRTRTWTRRAAPRPRRPPDATAHDRTASRCVPLRHAQDRARPCRARDTAIPDRVLTSAGGGVLP